MRSLKQVFLGLDRRACLFHLGSRGICIVSSEKKDLEPCALFKFLTGLAEQNSWKDLLTRSDYDILGIQAHLPGCFWFLKRLNFIKI